MNIQSLGSPVQSRAEERHTVAEQGRPPPMPPSSATPDEARASADDKEVGDAVKRINTALPPAAQGLEFALDDDSGQTIVKIVDKNTNEVVRQIPSAEALEIAKSLDKMRGLLIRDKA